MGEGAAMVSNLTITRLSEGVDFDRLAGDAHARQQAAALAVPALLAQSAALAGIKVAPPPHPKKVLIRKILRGEEIPTWLPVEQSNARSEVLKKRERMEAVAQSSMLAFNADAQTELSIWNRQERARRVMAIRLLRQGLETSAVAAQTDLEFAVVAELKERNK
jgi:hypothetical protein